MIPQTTRLPDDLDEALTTVGGHIHDRMAELLSAPEHYSSTIIPLNQSANEPVDYDSVEGEERVLEAMRYSALSGGKRLRPFLTICASRLFGVAYESALDTAVAIEFMHTYSLIHDDLPAMDNDDLRRGKPSCHKAFDEATAILAGDGLHAFAFEILSDPDTHADPKVRCELINALARAGGPRGMVGGQMMDMQAENKQLSVDEIIRLQRMKTGELFAVSCAAGAILGKAPAMMRKLLRAYAHDMGLAFQITDDLLDAEGTRKKAGKEVRKDSAAGKATLVESMGLEEARDHANVLVDQAISHLDVFDKKADHLRQLARFVIERKS